MSGKEGSRSSRSETHSAFSLPVPELLDLLKCPVCLEVYNIPLALPCLHTFCKECLQKIASDELCISCPICRDPHVLEVEDLKVNWDVNKLLDLIMTQRAKLCDECQEKEVNMHCKQCCADLCPHCDSRIHSLRLLAGHARHPVSSSITENKDKPDQSPPIEDDDIVAEFTIKRDMCLKKLHDWEASLWFAPKDLKQSKNVHLNTPLLVPYWLFEAETSSEYSANGRLTNVQTIWVKFSGTSIERYRHAVCATDVLHAEDVSKIEPWALDDLRPRTRSVTREETQSDGEHGTTSKGPKVLPFVIAEQQAWVIGKAEQRDVTSNEKSVVEELFKKMAMEDCEKAVRAKVGQVGTFKNLHVSTTITRLAAQRVFLPLYKIKYVYNRKPFLVLVNGQTGQLYGERPFNKFAAISGVAGLMGFFSNNQ